MALKKFESSSYLCFGLVLATAAVSACSDPERVGGAGPANPFLTELCLTLQNATIYGAPKDAIPALTDPLLVAANDEDADYLLPTDRVIGLNLPGEYIAVPHNIGWWHEIVNFTDRELAVTYCPLTGSSMVFYREAVKGADFGVSGLLFNNNLVMYDRASTGTEESLWPQMLASGRCGPGEGRELAMFPAVEMEWEDWVALHPDTKVLSKRQGLSRIYRAGNYPYGDYEREDNGSTLFPQPTTDSRRLPKERILGIPFEGGGAMAFPFGSLRDLGDLAVVHEVLGDGQEGSGGNEPIVVFWDKAAVGAMAFKPWISGQNLTFEVRDGAFVDLETESQWSLDGEALTGPNVGLRLEMIPEAYVSFWFAFSTFYPDLVLWAPEG